MLSKRDFLSIFLMMVTLFFIFQFVQVVKDNENNYDVNDHVIEVGLKASDVEVKDADTCVWLVGDVNGGVGDAVRQWCTYTRQELKCFSEIPAPEFDSKVEAIVIDPTTCDILNKTDKIEELTKMGTTIIFGDLPDASYVDSDEKLKSLLGITKVVKTQVHVEGVQIFSGFLLGGETVYAADKSKPEEKKFEDLDLDIAWYDTGAATKTYIVGIMDENEVHPYDFPKMIWRKNYNGMFIYAVNGDYLKGMMGIGFLDAMLYDTKEYYVYPVVNANNVVFADFPALSEENSEKLKSIYGRNTRSFQKDIAWPGIISIAANNEICLTCFMNERYDYTGEAKSDEDDIKFYLQQFKELGGEAGRSLDTIGNVSLAQKSEDSRAFYTNAGINYRFNALYKNKWDDALKDVLETKETGIRTVVCGNRGQEQAISFCSENVTLQYITNKADEYSFKNALLYKSLLTSLGYTNLLVDMNQALWPENKDDEWQNFFDHLFSYITTYWSDRMVFDVTTVSESDARIRKMLSVKYSSEKQGDNTVVLHSSGADENYFVFRTHDKEIAKISGNAEYTRIEKDAYLLKVHTGETVITLKDSEETYKYDGSNK
ncbi:MAG: DUF2194 domain-containing protein [Lachnospiraceae bacterium]|nr:DUF2194 domain-containing protein [Lachnospiraceae bacterium]